MNRPRILVVEDDSDIAELLRFNLEEVGYQAEICGRGLDGLERAQSRPPALVLLDLMLPDLSGIEICKRLRAGEATRALPIVMLTAKGEEIDRVVGFEVGADDYVTKPFSVRELLLRVRALLRRAEPAEGGKLLLRAGDLEVDIQGQRVRLKGAEIELTATEFRLLAYLLEHPVRLHTRDALLERVWDYAGDVESRTVDAHVRRLRAKLGDHADLVETVHGAGYRYNLTKYGKP